MENFLDTIISDNAHSLYIDLWNAIIVIFEKDGIDYMNEKDSIRIGVRNDTSTLFYKDKPYCMWTEPKIKFGLPDETSITIRAEILLKKL